MYDAQGRLKEKRSSGRRLVSYTYDKAGQITEIRDPAGVCTRYEYDILGRRSRVYNGDGLEVRYGYDALNRISRIHYGNGVETAYTYDGDGNISSLETKAGETVLLSFAYQYDGNGNRTAKAGKQASAAPGGITSENTAGSNALDISYHYDVRGQLLEERRNGVSVSYVYDKAGNRIKKADAQGATLYQFNRKNQLIAEESDAGRKQYTYDKQGGIVEERNPIGIRHFAYNSRHQQTRVETENGRVQQNRYDAENLRFELLENGRRTSFVYHKGELLHEEGREEPKSSYHLGMGIDAFQRGQELSYCHRDEQLSMALITGGQGGIQNSYQYDAFGVQLEEKEQFYNRIRYTGQQYDNLTEQYYLRARYYNPVLGRFMQEDVYQGDGLNLYVYCGNNPVVSWDPSGYVEECLQEQTGGDGGNNSENILNVGAGDSPIPGATNIDINPAAPGVVYGDVNDLSQFESGQFDQVVALNPYNYNILDSDVPRVLKEGGTLTVTGNYSNGFFRRIFRASAESLEESGFEIVSIGEPVSIFAQYGGKVTGGSRQTMGQVLEIILRKIGGK